MKSSYVPFVFSVFTALMNAVSSVWLRLYMFLRTSIGCPRSSCSLSRRWQDGTGSASLHPSHVIHPARIALALLEDPGLTLGVHQGLPQFLQGREALEHEEHVGVIEAIRELHDAFDRGAVDRQVDPRLAL